MEDIRTRGKPAKRTKAEPKPKKKKDYGLTLAGEPRKSAAGRPRAKIDLEVAQKLGELMCSYDECSAFMDIPASTLKSRPDFVEAWERGKLRGNIRLRRLLFQHAQTSYSMAIFLAKNHLGYKDNPDEETAEIRHEIVLDPENFGDMDDDD